MKFKFIEYLVVTTCVFLSVSFLQPVCAANNIYQNKNYQSDNEIFTHKVLKGETVYSIATQYKITVADIYGLNPKAEKGIKEGDKLKIARLSSSVSDNQTSVQGVTVYKAKAKETLYSISKKFEISIEELLAQNPELKLKPLAEGQSLRISKSGLLLTPVQSTSSQFIEHAVSAKETIYGIAKQYNVTVDALIDFNPSLKNGLKQGTSVIIPVMQTGGVITSSPSDGINKKASTLTDIHALNIGLILPFRNKTEAQTARFVEYYEGFLLALENLKRKGLTANVYVFDIGSDTGVAKLTSLLDTYEMKNLDLLIGGISPDQIDVMANFAKKHKVKYAIPFPTKSDETENNPFVFQVNAPYSVLYTKISNAFVNHFLGANVVFVSDNTTDENKDFVSALTLELSRKGMTSKILKTGTQLSSDLILSLDANRKNVIVPISGSVQMLQTLLPVLNTVVAEQPDIKLSLFGHNEWQFLPYQQNFGKYDTYIYSQLHFSQNDSRVKHFANEYSNWYNKTMINTSPRYGLLGYDAGIYFLSMLKEYGKDFQTKVNSMSFPTLQSAIVLKKSTENSGYINNGFYFIHFKSDSTIEKIEYGK